MRVPLDTTRMDIAAQERTTRHYPDRHRRTGAYHSTLRGWEVHYRRVLLAILMPKMDFMTLTQEEGC